MLQNIENIEGASKSNRKKITRLNDLLQSQKLINTSTIFNSTINF